MIINSYTQCPTYSYKRVNHYHNGIFFDEIEGWFYINILDYPSWYKMNKDYIKFKTKELVVCFIDNDFLLPYEIMKEAVDNDQIKLLSNS